MKFRSTGALKPLYANNTLPIRAIQSEIITLFYFHTYDRNTKLSYEFTLNLEKHNFSNSKTS